MSIERDCIQNIKDATHAPENLSILSEEIVAKAGIGIYIVQKGKFVYLGNLFTKITGYTEKELIGTNSLENIHSEDQEKVRKHAIKCLKKGVFRLCCA